MIVPANVQEIGDKLIKNGYEAYIIGGAVRDHIIGKEPKDHDIFTNASGEQILKLFPRGKVIGGEERQNKILTVVVNGIEVSQFRSSGDRTETGNNLDDHLATCDFTLNAGVFNMNTKELIAPHNIGKITAVGNPIDRIKEDKLRVLRAIRFASSLDIGIESALWDGIKNTDISDIPAERIREEFIKIIKAEGIILLSISGLLYQIIPEMKKLQINGGIHHDEEVLHHCFYAYEQASEHTDNELLIFAALLHDIGKGYTVEYNEEKKTTTFYNHEEKGAAIAGDIMRRLKFSKEDIKYVQALIKDHMSGVREGMKKSTLKKLFRRLHNAGASIYDLILLQYCDNQANMTNPRMKYHEYIKDNWTLQAFNNLARDELAIKKSDLDISGHDLMAMGIPAGPELGKIINEIFDRVDAGLLKNKKLAIKEFVKELLRNE